MFYEAPILKTKEGSFKCASLKTKRTKKKKATVFYVDMQWKGRAESCVLHVLSSRSPHLPPFLFLLLLLLAPRLSLPIMLFSAFSQGPGLLIPTVVNTVFV